MSKRVVAQRFDDIIGVGYNEPENEATGKALLACIVSSECAPVAQRIEHRSSELALSVPKGHFRYKLELLCQFPKTRFVRRIPSRYIQFGLVY